MSNRSKKVVLSARIEPYLKDGLELYARLKNQKIVEALEEMLSEAQESLNVSNPFHADGKETLNKIPVSYLISLIWTEDSILRRLRLGFISSNYCDEATFTIAAEVMSSQRFRGNIDIFSSTRAQIKHYDFALKYPLIDLSKVVAEWEYLEKYAEFAAKSKPAIVEYEDFLRIIGRVDPNAPL